MANTTLCRSSSWARLYEVQKYVTRLEHIYNTDVWVINNEWFTSLPEDYQQIIIEAAEVANTVGRGVTSIANATAIDLLVSEGTSLHPLPRRAKGLQGHRPT